MFFKFARSHQLWLRPEAEVQGLLKESAIRFSLNPEENFYIESWAVSAWEDFGSNENHDAFERAELKLAYRTFVDSWACLDHENWDESLKIGSNPDAVYTPQNYVKVLMAVDRKLAESRRPGIERAIQEQRITDTSMGAWCTTSVCNVCGNVAAMPQDFCDHIRPPKRGTMICDASTNFQQKKAVELNRGVVFFENSIITTSEGADQNAKILAKLASSGLRQTPVGLWIAGDRLYGALWKIAAEDRTEHGKMFWAHLIERLGQQLDGEAEHGGEC